MSEPGDRDRPTGPPLFRGTADGESLLERLTPGERGPAVVLFPPVLGEMVGYAILIEALRDEAQVFGLRQPMDVRAFEPAFIDKLCARYAEEIAMRRLAGPVFFVGWSLGAILAYETGRRLEGSAQAPGSVILVDPSPMEQSLKSLIPHDDAARERFVWDFYLSTKLYPEQRAALVDDGGFWTLPKHDRYKEVARSAPTFLGPFKDHFREMEQWREHEFVRASTEGLMSFDVHPYRGTCEIVCCEQFKTWVEAQWPLSILPGRRITTVGGDHDSIMFHFSIDVIQALVLGASHVRARATATWTDAIKR